VRILVLGGYGGTGRVFCRYLLRETDVEVIVAGRNREKAEEWAATLQAEFPPERISARTVDAADPGSLGEAFRNIDFVLVAATTTPYARAIAEAALEARIDYLDIYYQQDVYPVLETLQERIRDAGRCFITQAGFHPGLPAPFIRKSASSFDTFNRAVVAFAMRARIEKPESVYELVDALADYKADIYKDGLWRPGSYRDAVKVDFGGDFGVKSCFPLNMVETRALPEMTGLREVGVYAAGFNWLVDYVIFPLILLSQIIRRGLFRRFWAGALVWGMNHFTPGEEGIVFLLQAEGIKDGYPREIILRSEHRSAYDFTVIPVVAALRQYLQGSLRKPGLWMMGHLVDPDRLFEDMEKMGAPVRTTIMKAGAGVGSR
jgi:hypothetical protein